MGDSTQNPVQNFNFLNCAKSSFNLIIVYDVCTIAILYELCVQFIQYNTSYYIVIFAQKSLAFFVHFLIGYFLKMY